MRLMVGRFPWKSIGSFMSDGLMNHISWVISSSPPFAISRIGCKRWVRCIGRLAISMLLALAHG